MLVYGAGAAGLGVARQLKAAMVQNGLDASAAQIAVGVMDSGGLLVDDRKLRDAYKTELAWPAQAARSIGLRSEDSRDLAAVVDAFRPHVLIGSSGQPGAFARNVVERMLAHNERPVILPFSNPTDRAEATPADLIEWTHGRALIATGSPFAPVEHHGRTIEIGQGNNVFVFPGLGLGTLESRAVEVTDAMVSAASAALAATVSEDELQRGLLFPAVDRLRDVTREVAIAVARQAESDGVARRRADVVADLDRVMWSPEYQEYRPDDESRSSE